jgi:hypothetical protein
MSFHFPILEFKVANRINFSLLNNNIEFALVGICNPITRNDKKQYSIDSTTHNESVMKRFLQNVQNEFVNFQLSCENKAAEFSIEIIFKENFQNLRFYNERTKPGQSKTKLSK